MTGVIDLNADLGEGVGVTADGDHVSVDAAMLAVVTSANVACGFHAGAAATMRRVCALAAQRGVAVGAHVSYRDRENFGRQRVFVTPQRLAQDVLEQIETLQDVARSAGTAVRYVKPHGALYNVSALERETADAITIASSQADPNLILLGLPHSQLEVSAMRRDLDFVAEAFADRAYLADGRLVPRSEPGAVLHDPRVAVRQALAIARDGMVVATDGSAVPVQARSLCVHGDTPGAADLAMALRTALLDAGLVLAPFAATP
jgi:UPF0271 protein